MIEWEIESSGFQEFPHRFVINIADFSPLLWWSTVVAIPVITYSASVLVWNDLVYFYTMYSAVIIMAILQTSERFANMEVEYEHSQGCLTVTYNMGEPSLFAEQERTVSLEDIDEARFMSLFGRSVVRLCNEGLFTYGATILVPPGADGQFRDSLHNHGISIKKDSVGNIPAWVWGRCSVTVLLLGVLPVYVILVWPVAYSWAVLLVLLVYSIYLSRQGW